MPDVDRDARRAAVLYEIAAVATRYEQDVTPPGHETRKTDLLMALDNVLRAYTDDGHRASVTELAGRCVAFLEHLAWMEAKT